MIIFISMFQKYKTYKPIFRHTNIFWIISCANSTHVLLWSCPVQSQKRSEQLLQLPIIICHEAVLSLGTYFAELFNANEKEIFYSSCSHTDKQIKTLKPRSPIKFILIVTDLLCKIDSLHVTCFVKTYCKLFHC